MLHDVGRGFFGGISSLYAQGDNPVSTLKRVTNLLPSIKLGGLVKRDGTEQIITGLTAVDGAAEVVDANGERALFLNDNGTIKRAAYSSGYGTPTAPTNDERDGSATVSEFNPVVINGFLVAGVGNGANDDAIKAQYLSEADRFDSAETVSAGVYVTPLNTDGVLESILKPSTNEDHGYVAGVAAMVSHASDVAEGGFAGETGASFVTVYAVPVFDNGAEYGLPVEIGSVPAGSSVSRGSVSVILNVLQADAELAPRLFAVDIYCTLVKNSSSKDALAYYSERIKLQDDGDYFYESTGSVDNGASTITLANFANWRTMDLVGFYIYNVTDGETYEITGDGSSGTDALLTVSPAPTNTASGKELKIFSKWDSTTWFGDSVYQYRTFIDNYMRPLGSEMYSEIGVQRNDVKPENVNFKYASWAGGRLFTCGYSGDKRSFGYFSPVNQPGILAELNIVGFDSEPVGCAPFGNGHIVFTKRFAYQVSVYTDDQAVSRQFSDAGCVSHKSIVNISDETVVWMSPSGPWIAQGASSRYLGLHIRELISELGITEAQMAECVGGYDQIRQLVKFSFPTFSNTEFPNGIILVYDLQADAITESSPWVVFDNATSLKTACLAMDNHLISFSDTAGYDWNGTPDELVATAIEIHPMRNRIHGKELWIKKVYIESEGLSPTVTTYVDESVAASDSLTFMSKSWQWIRRICTRFSIRATTAASLSSYTLRGVQIEYTEKGAE